MVASLSCGARITLTSPDPSSDTHTRTHEHTHTAFSGTGAVTFDPLVVLSEPKTHVEASVDPVAVGTESAADVDYDEETDDGQSGDGDRGRSVPIDEVDTKSAKKEENGDEQVENEVIKDEL